MSTQGHDSLGELKREIDHAMNALPKIETSALSNLMCRISDLQSRFLGTEARTLAELEIRLGMIRDIVAGLGEPGFLLHLVDAAVKDVRVLQGQRSADSV
jgi:hypothetical protein